MAHVNIDERRLRMQDLMNQDLSRKEIGKICSTEFGCTVGTIYSDLNLFGYKRKKPYKPISGVYMIYCLGGYYIGASKDIENRWKTHKRQLKGTRHQNDDLQLAYIESRGVAVFSVILECDPHHIYIEEYNQITLFRNNGYKLYN